MKKQQELAVKKTNSQEFSGPKKWWFHTKYFLKSSTGKKTIIALSLSSFAVLLVTPIIINSITQVPYAITPYKRDANSGTSVAFEELYLEKKSEDKYGLNTSEVKSNDSMVQAVSQVNNSVGYVSLASLPSSITTDLSTSDGDPMLANEDYVVMQIYYDPDDSGTKYTADWYSPVDPNNPSKPEDGYPARNFNVFWRGDENTFEANDITDIKLVYGDDPSTPTVENVWYWQNLYNDDIWNNSTNSYQEAVNWGLYNFLIYSQSAWTIAKDEGYIPPIINKLGETGWTTTNPVTGASDALFEEYIDKVVVEYGTQPIFDLFTIGSTSVGATSDGLLDKQINYFLTEIAQPNSVNFRHQADHIGSGDAMQNGSSSKYEAYLGFQSKEAKESDIEKYYGGKDLTTQQIHEVYNPFVQDILVVIANPNNIDECKAGITQTGLRDLYLSSTQYSWDMLYERYATEYLTLNTCS